MVSPVYHHFSDCGNLTVLNGEFNAPSGTTLGQWATQSCDIGYKLAGDENIICTDSGWNGTAVNCSIVGKTFIEIASKT